jgi:hypothetical protein
MRRVLFAVVAAAVVLLAGSALAARSAGSMHGVVVGHQLRMLLVASSRGRVQAVAGRARVGERVVIRNGRLVGALGRAQRAVIHAVVVRHNGRLTFLSASGHLLVVRATRAIASVADTAPTPGTVVQQTVSFDDQGGLDDQGEQDVGQTGQTQIQAQISAVGPGTVTVTVNGQPLVIPLPAGLTLPSSLVGTQVTLNLSFAGGQATAEDDQGDNSQGDDQGDQGDQNDQGDQSTTTTTTTTGDNGGD